MTQRKRIRLIVGVALVASLVLLGIPRPRSRPAPGPPVVSSVPKGAPAPLPPQHATRERLEAQLARREQGEWGPDPFEQAVPVHEDGSPRASVVEDLRLEGISRSGDAWMALIGRDLVQQGERLSTGHTVEAITQDSVTLKKDGRTLTLRLGENR